MGEETVSDVMEKERAVEFRFRDFAAYGPGECSLGEEPGTRRCDTERLYRGG